MMDSWPKYKNLVEEIGGKFVIFSHKALTGELLYVSAGVVQIFGIYQEAALGKDWSQIINWLPDSLYQARSIVEEMVKGKRDFIQHEMCYIHPDGSVRTIHVSCHPGRDDDGNVVTIDGIAEDITERKKSEKALEESEKRLRSIVEMAADGIINIDEKGLISHFNPASERIFGYLSEEVTGKNVSCLMPEPHRGRHDGYICSYLKKGGNIRHIGMELEGLRKNGSLFPLELSINVFDDENGKMFTGIVRDITDRKKAENALRQAKKVAEEANRAKSEFLATMSHEIRTPMNAILGMANLLEESPLSDMQQKYCEVLVRSGEHLLNIINDILDFSKIESGRLSLNFQAFNLRALLNDICNLMSIQAREKGLGLNLKIDPDVPFSLVGDPDRLRQILINLIGNAMKFTKEGDVTITIGNKEGNFDPSNEDQSTLLFSVADTGIGIPADSLSRIFEKFEQLNTQSTREYGGTGLGLAISKRLVTLMGGEVRVESSPGRGSVFSFYAKFRVDRRSKPADRAPETADQEIVGESFSRYRGYSGEIPAIFHRILIVDDSLDNQFLIRAYIRNRADTIDSADNGQAALEKHRAKPYDLILMDLEMPVMDGYSAMKAIRRWEHDFKLQPVPIVALSAHAFKEHEEKSIDAGCSAFLSKPVRKSALVDCLNKLSVISLQNRQPVTSLQEVSAKDDMEEIDPEIADLVPGFLKNKILDVEKISEALEAEDYETIRLLSHSMKGSGKGYGFPEITRIGGQLEQEAKNRNRVSIRSETESLRRYLNLMGEKYGGK